MCMCVGLASAVKFLILVLRRQEGLCVRKVINGVFAYEERDYLVRITLVSYSQLRFMYNFG